MGRRPAQGRAAGVMAGSAVSPRSTPIGEALGELVQRNGMTGGRRREMRTICVSGRRTGSGWRRSPISTRRSWTSSCGCGAPADAALEQQFGQLSWRCIARRRQSDRGRADSPWGWFAHHRRYRSPEDGQIQIDGALVKDDEAPDQTRPPVRLEPPHVGRLVRPRPRAARVSEAADQMSRYRLLSYPSSRSRQHAAERPVPVAATGDRPGKQFQPCKLTADHREIADRIARDYETHQRTQPRLGGRWIAAARGNTLELDGQRSIGRHQPRRHHLELVGPSAQHLALQEQRRRASKIGDRGAMPASIDPTQVEHRQFHRIGDRVGIHGTVDERIAEKWMNRHPVQQQRRSQLQRQQPTCRNRASTAPEREAIARCGASTPPPQRFVDGQRLRLRQAALCLTAANVDRSPNIDASARAPRRTIAPGLAERLCLVHPAHHRARHHVGGDRTQPHQRVRLVGQRHGAGRQREQRCRRRRACRSGGWRRRSRPAPSRPAAARRRGRGWRRSRRRRWWCSCRCRAWSRRHGRCASRGAGLAAEFAALLEMPSPHGRAARHGHRAHRIDGDQRGHRDPGGLRRRPRPCPARP